MKKSTCCLAMLILCYSFVFAQDTVLRRMHGKLDSIQSAVLQQKRYIQVFVPQDYKPGSGKTYDVLYVLDGGNWNTGLVADVEHFVENEGLMPPTIIVSVMGIDRNRELTPTHMSDAQVSGGGPQFLAYLKNELIPYIHQHYPANGDNTLWGHSLSAMFAIYAMLEAPGLFKSYIAMDPSTWWDKAYVAKLAAEKMPLIKQPTTLFIAAREGNVAGMRTDTLEAVLKAKAPKNLNWKLQVYSGESHSSVRYKGTYDALRFTYEGMTAAIAFHPMQGIVLKDQPYPIWYFEDTSRLHYTLDGSVPTTQSPIVPQTLMVTGPKTIIYESFSNRERYSQSATGDFTVEKLPEPDQQPKGYQPGGFNYTYYDLKGDTSSSLQNRKPLLSGKNVDPGKLPAKNNYALIIDGYLQVTEDGYYIFGLAADKGSKLYIDGRLMITWDGDYNRRNYSCILPLKKGFYPLRLEYHHRNADFQLDWAYVTPSGLKTKHFIPIPAKLQYGR